MARRRFALLRTRARRQHGRRRRKHATSGRTSTSIRSPKASSRPSSAFCSATTPRRRSSRRRSWTGAIPTVCRDRAAPSETPTSRRSCSRYRRTRSFREVEELQNVMGMTPEIYALATPYLTVRGSGAVNVNTAPVPVLRALPGMTDATLNRILQLRSQGRRISSIDEIFADLRGGRPAVAGQLGGPGAINRLQSRTFVSDNGGRADDHGARRSSSNTDETDGHRHWGAAKAGDRLVQAMVTRTGIERGSKRIQHRASRSQRRSSAPPTSGCAAPPIAPGARRWSRRRPREPAGRRSLRHWRTSRARSAIAGGNARRVAHAAAHRGAARRAAAAYATKSCNASSRATRRAISSARGRRRSSARHRRVAACAVHRRRSSQRRRRRGSSR